MYMYNIYFWIYTYSYMCIWICIYMCVCVCVHNVLAFHLVSNVLPSVISFHPSVTSFLPLYPSVISFRYILPLYPYRL